MDINLPGGIKISLTRTRKPKLPKPRCGECQREFGFFERSIYCKYCGVLRCRKCTKGMPKLPLLAPPFGLGVGRACNSCYASRVKHFVELEWEFGAGEIHVEVFPATYRGKIPLVEGSRKDKIQTKIFREKAEATQSLQFTAAFLGCDVVVEVAYDKLRDSEPGTGDGTHYFTVWKASGIPARLRN